MTTTSCRCGCGEEVHGRRVFVNKQHQLRWMVGGGASEPNDRQPLTTRVEPAGGAVVGARGTPTSKAVVREEAACRRAADDRTPQDASGGLPGV